LGAPLTRTKPEMISQNQTRHETGATWKETLPRRDKSRRESVKACSIASMIRAVERKAERKALRPYKNVGGGGRRPKKLVGPKKRTTKGKKGKTADEPVEAQPKHKEEGRSIGREKKPRLEKKKGILKRVGGALLAKERNRWKRRAGSRFLFGHREVCRVKCGAIGRGRRSQK